MRPKSIFDKNQHGFCRLGSKRTIRSKLGRHQKILQREGKENNEEFGPLRESFFCKIFEPKITNRN